MREEEAELVLRAPEFEFWPRILVEVMGPGSSGFVFLELQIPFIRWGGGFVCARRRGGNRLPITTSGA